jgi:hypothetical protein
MLVLSVDSDGIRARGNLVLSVIHLSQDICIALIPRIQVIYASRQWQIDDRFRRDLFARYLLRRPISYVVIGRLILRDITVFEYWFIAVEFYEDNISGGTAHVCYDKGDPPKGAVCVFVICDGGLSGSAKDIWIDASSTVSRSCFST